MNFGGTVYLSILETYALLKIILAVGSGILDSPNSTRIIPGKRKK